MKTARASPLAISQHLLSASARAIAARPDLAITLGAPAPDQQYATSIELACPEETLTTQQFAALRGRADAVALWLRYHDPQLHAASFAPGHPGAALAVALEQVRVNTLGSRALRGVARNVHEALELHCHEHNYHLLEQRDQVPLAEALLLRVAREISVLPLPAAALRVVAAWGSVTDTLLSGLLPELAAAVADQARYARVCGQLLERMQLQAQTARSGGTRPSPESALQHQEEFAATDKDRSGIEATVPFAVNEGEGVDVSGRHPVRRLRARSERHTSSDGRSLVPISGLAARAPYRAFSAEHDQVVAASELCAPAELTRLRARLDELLQRHGTLASKLAGRLQNSLLALQRREWTRDLEEGQLDPSRLARAVINPLRPLSFRRERDLPLRDTVVSLLIDNSGSMSGAPIETAAMCADVLVRTLERCHIGVEILGFTTRAWKGGRLREQWFARGRPQHPGRLNELRHIVYKSADQSWRRARDSLGLMLDPALLKENIDGEALLWAHQRLMTRPELRRILIVVCDGEPSDEMSVEHNGGDYLERHLREVIRWIENRSPAHLLAIGIGHDVSAYYRRAMRISSADQLGAALVSQLATLLVQDTDEWRRHAGSFRALAGQ